MVLARGRVPEKSINLGILHTVNLQQGEKLFVRRGDGASSPLDLNGGLNSAAFMLRQSPLQAGDVLALTLARLLLALAIGLAVGGHSDL